MTLLEVHRHDRHPGPMYPTADAALRRSVLHEVHEAAASKPRFLVILNTGASPVVEGVAQARIAPVAHADALVVSRREVAVPDDLNEGGVVYRYIDIPVEPRVPSRA